jgi:predicted translin family RNA/ssDNA-binding protein
MPITLEKIQRDLEQFPYDLQMYCYHHMNNRFIEAQTYLDAYQTMQKNIVEELKQDSEYKDNTGNEEKE